MYSVWCDGERSRGWGGGGVHGVEVVIGQLSLSIVIDRLTS